jgi:hypothetical protein
MRVRIVVHSFNFSDALRADSSLMNTPMHYGLTEIHSIVVFKENNGQSFSLLVCEKTLKNSH